MLCDNKGKNEKRNQTNDPQAQHSRRDGQEMLVGSDDKSGMLRRRIPNVVIR